MTTPAYIASAVETMGKLFEGKSPAEQKALLAALERAGAALAIARSPRTNRTPPRPRSCWRAPNARSRTPSCSSGADGEGQAP